MFLKSKYKKEDEIPEGMAVLYKEVNGEWFFQHDEVEGVVPSAKVKEFRDNNIALTNENKELNKKFKAFEGIDPEKYNALIEKEKEFDATQMIKNDEVEALITKRTQAMTEENEKKIKHINTLLAAEQERAKNLKTDLASVKITNTISSALSKLQGFNPEFQDLAIMLGEKQFKMNDTFAVEARDDNNDIIYSKNGVDPLSIDEWVNSLPDTRPSMMKSSSGMDSKGNLGKKGNDSLKGTDGKTKISAAFKQELG